MEAWEGGERERERRLISLRACYMGSIFHLSSQSYFHEEAKSWGVMLVGHCELLLAYATHKHTPIISYFREENLSTLSLPSHIGSAGAEVLGETG